MNEWLWFAACALGAALFLYRRQRPTTGDVYMSEQWVNDQAAESRKDREGVWWPKDERGREDRRKG